MFAAPLSVWVGRRCLLIGGAPFDDHLAETDSFRYLGARGASIPFSWFKGGDQMCSFVLFLAVVIRRAEIGHDWSWKWLVFIHTHTHTDLTNWSSADISVWKSLPAWLGGQGLSDGTDGEEAERCPICLGVLPAGELAMPDSCCHVFCLRCLLTWAEVSRHCYKTILTSCSIYLKLSLFNAEEQKFEGFWVLNIQSLQFSQ